jgi:autotransporter-associated beta strand protein
MRKIRVRTAAAAVALFLCAAGICVTGGAHAQAPTGPVSIPLSLVYVDTPTVAAQYRLGVYVGINGGAVRPYIFDTGSSIFNAVYTQSAWPGFTAPAGLSPNSTVTNGNGIQYCYGTSTQANCRGYVGNIVQVPTLQFYTAPVLGTAQTVYSSLSATSSGYQVNAIDYLATPGQTSTMLTPIAGATSPTVEGIFYGTFGAGDFASLTNTGYTSGGVLGQTSVSNVVAQGYVVAANGQTNPVTTTSNPPQQANGQMVTLGGVRQNVTACSPCVTVGLTREVLGQFAIVSQAGQATGLVPWRSGATPPSAFPNPYTGGSGITGSVEFGTRFQVTLTSPSGSNSVFVNANTLLDTGTGDLTLSTNLESQRDISNANNVYRDVTMTVQGLDGSATIPGVGTSTSVLQGPDAAVITYQAGFDGGTGTTNTIGLSFFLQNSVLFDFSNQAVGYTRFFVTDANLSTMGGKLIVDGSNVPLGLAGVISGPEGVEIKSGAEVQLSAVNTYKGTTKVESGGLLNIAGIGSIASSSGVIVDGTFDISRAWVPVAIQTLSGNGAIYLGAQQLQITNGNGLTFSGVIGDRGGSHDTDGGSVALLGGVFGLSGSNTYTGGTYVGGGATLAVAADNSLGAVSGGLMLNQGTLQIGSGYTSARAVTLGSGGGTIDTNGFNLRLDTPVSGEGGLTKTGLGDLTLSGAQTYTGGTTVNQGILRLATGASLSPIGALTVNGGTFDFNGNTVTVGSLSGLGGTISMGTGSLVVTEAASTTLAANITGTGGLTMSGSGLLNLTGTNTYTGPTSVTNGRLAVNGSITSNVTVGSGGNLGGTGTINGTVNVLGAAAPGNSIGTLNVVGSYTQAAGSTYQVETNGAGRADRINVSGVPGTATLNGGIVTLTAATGVYAPSTTYTILNAAAGVTGAYAGANSLYPFLQPSLSYDANNVYLTLKPGGFGAGGATGNQSAVGRVLDRSVAGSSGDFATVIGTMATYSLLMGQAAMNAISGQNYAGFGIATVGNGLLFMNSLAQQMAAVRTGRGGGTRVALAEACDAVAVEACDGERASPWSIWGSAMGGMGTVAGNANAGTVTYNAGGFATGVDYRIDPTLLVGAGAGIASGNQWVGGFSGQGSTSSYQASLFASFTPGAFYLDGLAGYGYNDNQLTRQIVLPGLAARTAQGRTAANQFLGQAETGYRFDIYAPAAASLTPFARLQATGISQAAFTESGAQSLNLSVAQQTTTSVRTVLGAELAGGIDMGWIERLALLFRLGWAHEYADTARPTTAAFAGAPGQNFTVYGAAPQRDGVTLGFGASTAVAAGTSIYLRYDGEFSNGSSVNSLTGGFRMAW